ncbi:unnamed protein product [Menidia menidia]|uniref:(Atlantic silverside) hypothetical protein n=1 Tax=Menidia menidia TaxID=238744 RepID=A0A8S4BU76_9TELE|nr:unnamed protein product [Menidia menidia]
MSEDEADTRTWWFYSALVLNPVWPGALFGSHSAPAWVKRLTTTIGTDCVARPELLLRGVRLPEAHNMREGENSYSCTRRRSRN